MSDELLDPNSAFGGSTVEFNEKSLRLSYAGLQPNDRAEVYYRYPQQPRNFLNYREMRLWAVARRGRGALDGERLVVSVGTDARNRATSSSHCSRRHPPVDASARTTGCRRSSLISAIGSS